MRISDWSSDVCSSDLQCGDLLLDPGILERVCRGNRGGDGRSDLGPRIDQCAGPQDGSDRPHRVDLRHNLADHCGGGGRRQLQSARSDCGPGGAPGCGASHRARSHAAQNRAIRPTGATVDEAPEIGEILPDVFDVRSFSVRNLPSRWAPWDVARLIGDMFTDKLRMPCPVATNLCVEFPDPLASSNKASFKFMRTKSLPRSEERRVGTEWVSKGKS